MGFILTDKSDVQIRHTDADSLQKYTIRTTYYNI